MSVTTLEVNAMHAVFLFIDACHAAVSRQDFMLSVYPKLWKLLPHDMFAATLINLSGMRVEHCFNHSFPASYLRHLVTVSGTLLCPALGQWIQKARPIYIDLNDTAAAGAGKRWLNLARAYGIRNIAAHCVRHEDAARLSCFSFAGVRAWEPAHSSRLRLIAPHLRVAVSAVWPGSAPAPRDNNDNRVTSRAQLLLSERETEVLQWISHGKSNEEIAMILGISPWTVKIHVKHVMEKLDVTRRGQAVAAALKRGLIA